MTDALLQYETSDGVATLRLNRPDALNALNRALVQALIGAVEAARRDEAVRCLVVTGAGRAFSAGGDLKEMPTMTTAEFREYILLLQRLSAEMRGLSKPSIAAVNGYALAGGFELAVICDIRIAADSAIFGLPDTALGVSPTSGMTYLLPRIVGLGWAKHLTFTGESIDAYQAERIGLVTRVVPADQLQPTAQDMAQAIAAFPAVGLRYVKRGFDVAADVDLATALTYETDSEVTCFADETVRANMRAFASRKVGARQE